ncbi:MAG: hypothetical protein LUG50_05635 [Planctomycetaceae bacterium]|nr:hypothetical protein [Planctomycetaceae bacterium]
MEKMKLRYRYRSNGVKLCFSTGNRYDKPQPGTLPNIVTRMGPVALRYGLVAANNFTNAAIADIVTTVWESWITRIDIYVDVAIATDPFVEFVLDNRCAGRLSKKVRPYLKKKLTDDGCLTAVDGNGVHVNLGGDVEVVIYDKADKFDSDESEESKRVYEDKHGEITSKLTRFEFRFHRPFLTSWGYNGGHCINTVDDWLKCRASLVKYVMTKLFRFTEKDGKTLLVWEWIGNQFQNWVESDNDRLGITSVDIERVIKPQTVSVTRLFKQIAGTARTAMLRQTRERVRDEFQLMQWLQQEILKPEMREKVFNAAFHQDSALKYLKFKSQFDNSDILNNSIITSESQELEYGAIHYLLMGTSYDNTNINNTLPYNDI